MNKLLVERFAYTPWGTFGVLYMPEYMCYTVERPWLGNRVRVSCIPEGEYELKECMYFRGGYETYEILDVPDRTLIKIHIANTEDDVMGCIGVGTELGWVKGKWGITNSRQAFAEFKARAKDFKPEKIVVSQYLPQ